MSEAIDIDELERSRREMTPAPWQVVIEKGIRSIRGPGGNIIAVMHNPDPQTAPISIIAEQLSNAYSLVVAVNALPGLIARVKGLEAELTEALDDNKLELDARRQRDLTDISAMREEIAALKGSPT